MALRRQPAVAAPRVQCPADPPAMVCQGQKQPVTMPFRHHTQQLLFTDCRVAGGRKPPQSFQHTQRVGVQRHAGVYPFGSVKDQGGAFAADAADPPKRFDGGLKVPAPTHKITGQAIRYCALRPLWEMPGKYETRSSTVLSWALSGVGNISRNPGSARLTAPSVQWAARMTPAPVGQGPCGVARTSKGCPKPRYSGYRSSLWSRSRIFEVFAPFFVGGPGRS